MKVRPGFILTIALILLAGLILRYFYYRTDSNYWKAMDEIRLVKLKETKPVYIDGEIEPDFPDADENNATFYGMDSNKNGVRDDVEIWINRNFQTRNERMGYKQYQKAINRLYSKGENKKNYPEAIEFANRLLLPKSHAFQCVGLIEDALLLKNSGRGYYRFDSNTKKIQELTYNSINRRSSNAEFWHWTDGSDKTKYGYIDYSYEQRFKNCEFQLDKF